MRAKLFQRLPFERLFFCCLILSSKNAFEYNFHKLNLKQFDSNRWPSACKADVIISTPWNLKFMIFFCMFFLHFFGFFCELAIVIQSFDSLFLLSCYQKIHSTRTHGRSCSFVSSNDQSTMLSVSSFSRASVFFLVEKSFENFPRLSKLTVWGSELPNFSLWRLIFKRSFFHYEIEPGHSEEFYSYVITSRLWNP